MLDQNRNAKSGGWSASKVLHTGNPFEEVAMQAVFPISGDYTVQFTLEPQDAVDGTHPTPSAEADITWSVEGNFVTRRISVGNGVTVQGTAQGVRVKVRDVTPFVPGDLPIRYLVSMQVAPGTRAPVQQPPTLAITIGTVVPIGPGAFVDFPIPFAAGAISVYITALAVVGIGVLQPAKGLLWALQLTPGGGAVKYYEPRDYDDFVPLSPNTSAIRIWNRTLADTFEVSVTLGIDG